MKYFPHLVRQTKVPWRAIVCGLGSWQRAYLRTCEQVYAGAHIQWPPTDKPHWVEPEGGGPYRSMLPAVLLVRDAELIPGIAFLCPSVVVKVS